LYCDVHARAGISLGSPLQSCRRRSLTSHGCARCKAPRPYREETMKYQVPDHVYVREFEEEFVLLDGRSGKYFGLDAIGRRVWTCVTTNADREALERALLTEYACEPDELKRDVAQLISELVRAGLLDTTND
jgi:Coenzyme PQQ synthesis protein D (PqqD)